MRIALVYDALYPETKGGVERRVWELAQRLVRRGHSVHLLVPRMWAGQRAIERSGVIIRGVGSGRSLYTRAGRRAILPALEHAIGVFRLLVRERFDLVDCQVPAYLGCLAARMATRRKPNAAQIVTWHEAWGSHWIEEFGIRGQVGRLVEKLVTRLPVTHVSVSSSTEAALLDLGRTADAVVEAGVDIARIRSIASDVWEWDISFVGRLVPSKNLGLLLEAIQLLASEGFRFRVVVIGGGPYRERWETQSKRLGLGEFVLFKGELDDWDEVVRILKGSKILALPSLREGYGMIAVEAAACGLPVVTVDHHRNAARDLVVSGRTGLTVAAAPREFADALKALLQDDELRQVMGKNAAEWARHLTWNATLEATLAVYQRVLA